MLTLSSSINGVERWLTYDDEDRLDKVYSDSTHTTQVAEYDYDVDGFLTTKTEGSDVTTYDYNSQGQLLEVVLPDTTVIEYRHDALGRRVAKVVDSVVTEKYLWAGMNQGLLAVYNGSDQLVVRYKYAGGRLPVSFTYSSATYYPVYDQVGSLRAIYNTSGDKVHEITYDSFGNILSESGTFTGPVPHGFAGGLHDRHTGLVRFGFRDYDPKAGRWTAKDPIRFAGGDVGLYGYVLSDPILFYDELGLALSAPGFWEGFIPVWGSGRQAIHDFQCGDWGWGLFNTAMAVTDVIPIRAAAGMLGKGAWKVGGSHTWDATRKWMRRRGYGTPGSPFHHWLIPQSGWGRIVPDWIKNQPWNVMDVGSRAWHNAIEGKGPGALSMPGRIWHGSPPAVRAAGISGSGKAVNSGRGEDTGNGCGCN